MASPIDNPHGDGRAGSTRRSGIQLSVRARPRCSRRGHRMPFHCDDGSLITSMGDGRTLDARARGLVVRDGFPGRGVSEAAAVLELAGNAGLTLDISRSLSPDLAPAFRQGVEEPPDRLATGVGRAALLDDLEPFALQSPMHVPEPCGEVQVEVDPIG